MHPGSAGGGGGGGGGGGNPTSKFQEDQGPCLVSGHSILTFFISLHAKPFVFHFKHPK